MQPHTMTRQLSANHQDGRKTSFEIAMDHHHSVGFAYHASEALPEAEADLRRIDPVVYWRPGYARISAVPRCIRLRSVINSTTWGSTRNHLASSSMHSR